MAPDYVLAHESICDKLIEQMKKYIVGFYGERPLQDGNYPKIINEKHYCLLYTSWSVCSCWKRYVKEISVQLTCKTQSKRLPGRISRESLQRLWRDFCRKNIVMRRFFGRRQ